MTAPDHGKSAVAPKKPADMAIRIGQAMRGARRRFGSLMDGSKPG
jgi:hypothetical protein